MYFIFIYFFSCCFNAECVLALLLCYWAQQSTINLIRVVSVDDWIHRKSEIHVSQNCFALQRCAVFVCQFAYILLWIVYICLYTRNYKYTVFIYTCIHVHVVVCVFARLQSIPIPTQFIQYVAFYMKTNERANGTTTKNIKLIWKCVHVFVLLCEAMKRAYKPMRTASTKSAMCAHIDCMVHSREWDGCN